MRAVDLVIDGPVTLSDIPDLCSRARVLLGSDADLLVCDVGALVRPDAVTVDALARLQLTARRLGRQIRLRHAPIELRELLDLVGLSDVLLPERAHGSGTRGSPKSGNRVAVSRKNVNSTIRPPDTSST